MEHVPINKEHLKLLAEAATTVNKYLDAVKNDEIFDIKKRRWLEVKDALNKIGEISPELKNTFLQTHNLSLTIK